MSTVTKAPTKSKKKAGEREERYTKEVLVFDD